MFQPYGCGKMGLDGWMDGSGFGGWVCLFRIGALGFVGGGLSEKKDLWFLKLVVV